MKVIRKATGVPAEVKFVQVGHVKTGPTVVSVEVGENFVSVPLATGVTMDASTLGTKITAGPQISAADNVVINNGDNSFKSIFFSTDEFDGGWRDAGSNPFGSFLVSEGKAFNILNTVPPPAGSAAFNLTFPAQVITIP
jgi:hypothetical protein